MCNGSSLSLGSVSRGRTRLMCMVRSESPIFNSTVVVLFYPITSQGHVHRGSSFPFTALFNKTCRPMLNLTTAFKWPAYTSSVILSILLSSPQPSPVAQSFSCEGPCCSHLALARTVPGIGGVNRGGGLEDNGVIVKSVI